jgi:putative Mn2+ efflux pump MntP
MTFLEMILMAVGLAMDASAVSLGISTTGQSQNTRARFRLSFHFGLFQALMPVLGWAGGLTIEPFIRNVDHWVAFGLLAYVGGRMIRSGFSHEQETYIEDPSRGWTLIMLAVATSIDALAVGLSLAMIHVPIVTPAIIIGVVTGGMSLSALLAGHQLGMRFGKRMEIIGGIILLIIGLRIIITHLFM